MKSKNKLPYSVRIAQYEAAKSELERLNLTVQEYARRVRELARKYNV